MPPPWLICHEFIIATGQTKDLSDKPGLPKRVVKTIRKEISANVADVKPQHKICIVSQPHCKIAFLLTVYTALQGTTSQQQPLVKRNISWHAATSNCICTNEQELPKMLIRFVCLQRSKRKNFPFNATIQKFLQPVGKNKRVFFYTSPSTFNEVTNILFL